MFTPNSNHIKATHAREQAQSVQALSLYEEALSQYIDFKNFEGIIRVLLEKDITYRHLWFFTEHSEYLELSASALQLAEHTFHKNEHQLDASLRSLVLFHVGQVTEAVGEPLEAIAVYQEALSLLEKKNPLYGNVLSHLAQSEWSANETKNAQQHFLEAHELLSKNATQVDEYTATVWLSGSYLRQAECLLKTNTTEANKFLQETRKILDSKTFPIRWQQLEKLETLLAKK